MQNNDRIYKKYASNHPTFASHKSISRKDVARQFPAWDRYFSEFLPKDKNAIILDAGCGDGLFSIWLDNLGYNNIIGVDISDEQIEQAKKIGIGILLQSDINDFLSKHTNEFDCIFARDIIEHFNHDSVVVLLDGLNKSLKPNGSLIIQTPNAESPFGAHYRYADFTHQISFTEVSLGQALRISGFKEIKFYPTGPVVHGVISFIRKCLWQLIVICLKMFNLIELGTPSGIFTRNFIAYAKK